MDYDLAATRAALAAEQAGRLDPEIEADPGEPTQALFDGELGAGVMDAMANGIAADGGVGNALGEGVLGTSEPLGQPQSNLASPDEMGMMVGAPTGVGSMDGSPAPGSAASVAGVVTEGAQDPDVVGPVVREDPPPKLAVVPQAPPAPQGTDGAAPPRSADPWAEGGDAALLQALGRDRLAALLEEAPASGRGSLGDASTTIPASSGTNELAIAIGDLRGTIAQGQTNDALIARMDDHARLLEALVVRVSEPVPHQRTGDELATVLAAQLQAERDARADMARMIERIVDVRAAEGGVETALRQFAELQELRFQQLVERQGFSDRDAERAMAALQQQIEALRLQLATHDHGARAQHTPSSSDASSSSTGADPDPAEPAWISEEAPHQEVAQMTQHEEEPSGETPCGGSVPCEDEEVEHLLEPVEISWPAAPQVAAPELTGVDHLPDGLPRAPSMRRTVDPSGAAVPVVLPLPLPPSSRSAEAAGPESVRVETPRPSGLTVVGGASSGSVGGASHPAVAIHGAAQAVRGGVSPDRLAGFERAGQPGTDGEVVVGVEFARGSSQVRPADRVRVADAVANLGDAGSRRFVLLGFTDTVPVRGNALGNWDLGYRRARSLFAVLQGAGVDPRRIRIASHGEHLPVTLGRAQPDVDRSRRALVIAQESSSFPTFDSEYIP